MKKTVACVAVLTLLAGCDAQNQSAQDNTPYAEYAAEARAQAAQNAARQRESEVMAELAACDQQYPLKRGTAVQRIMCNAGVVERYPTVFGRDRDLAELATARALGDAEKVDAGKMTLTEMAADMTEAFAIVNATKAQRDAAQAAQAQAQAQALAEAQAAAEAQAQEQRRQNLLAAGMLLQNWAAQQEAARNAAIQNMPRPWTGTCQTFGNMTNCNGMQ